MNELKFENKGLDIKKLKQFGFEDNGDFYVYIADLLDGQFRLTVIAETDGVLKSELIDTSSNEEYVLHLVENAAGAFIGKIREEYEAIIADIRNKCFFSDIYKLQQTKDIIEHIRAVYGDELEYPWNDENAVARRKDNNKWYAVFLKVSGVKLGLDCTDTAEILNLKAKPENINCLIDGKSFIRAYHMNKKHWVTVLLDSGVKNDKIFRMIDDSFRLAEK